MTGLVTMAGTDEELSLYSGTPAHRKQLWDLHHAIAGTGGDIAWLSVSENKTTGRFVCVGFDLYITLKLFIYVIDFSHQYLIGQNCFNSFLR